MQIEEKEYDQSFDWRIWKKLFPFMKPFRKYMIIALVFNTLCALVDIALPLFQRKYDRRNWKLCRNLFSYHYISDCQCCDLLPLCYGD